MFALATQPPVDRRQSETAASVQRGVCRMLRQTGFATLCEFSLPSGRRADVIAMGPAGSIWIVEIKSSPTDYLCDHKWPDYFDFCDRLYFAIPPTMDRDILADEAGLIVADSWGAEIMREVPDKPLPAARRKSVTLRFARAAALRLHGLYDPAPVEA